MIKRCSSIVLALVLVAALGLPALGYTEDLPTIELKDVRLRGTVISGIFKPTAIVEHVPAKKNCWYRVGDTLCGGRIVKIQRGAIVLEMNKKRYLFGLPQGEVEGAASVLSEGEETIALGEKVGDNIWRVKLDTAIDVLTRATKIMKEPRIKPYFALGKAAGIRIDRIKDGSIIEEMGLKDGDIIKGVNGFGLMTPTKIFEAYRRYKNSRLIELQLIRSEEPATLTYNIVR